MSDVPFAPCPSVGEKPGRQLFEEPRRCLWDVQDLSPELSAGVTELAAERGDLRDELAKARRRIAALERLADEDWLTSLANRRAFVRELTRMVAFTHRYGVPASVAYFDVNNMKRINDQQGHPAGDAALRHVATVLRNNVRSSDVVGRLGGDEFGVIFAQTDGDQAQSKAATLAATIARTPLLRGGIPMTVTAAYGVYSLFGTDDPEHAIEAADCAMYLQKGAALRDIVRLSNREQMILKQLMHGAPNKCIARALNIAEATVKVHIKSLLRKIRVENRTQAAIWAMNHPSGLGLEQPSQQIGAS
jgi:diguanylate cyclase (GGDEF)-like protein